MCALLHARHFSDHSVKETKSTALTVSAGLGDHKRGF